MTTAIPLRPVIKIKEPKQEAVTPSDFGSGTPSYQPRVKQENAGMGVGFLLLWIVVGAAAVLIGFNPLNWDLNIDRDSTLPIQQQTITDESSETDSIGSRGGIQCAPSTTGYNVGIAADGTCYKIMP